MDVLDGTTRYRKIRNVGEGAYGSVELAVDTATGMHVAIKYIKLGSDAKDFKYLLNEVTNHWRLAHPLIVQFKEVYLAVNHIAIVMEYVEGIDLFHYIEVHGPLAETDARWFFQQLVVAVDYLHRMGVANRDLKLENILLDKSPRPLLKVCDFGFSKHNEHQSSPKSMVGTLHYTAPEVLQSSSYDGKISDVWSCGVVLYTMVTAAYPFTRDADDTDVQRFHKIIQRIKKGEYKFPRKFKASIAFFELLHRMLHVEPEGRITIAEIQKHPWYLHMLPEGVASANDQHFLGPPLPQVLQTLEDVTDLIHRAQTLQNERAEVLKETT